ncbi:MAG: hypothetical protein Q9195_006770 [Heterodermia aff. obscurata]
MPKHKTTRVTQRDQREIPWRPRDTTIPGTHTKENELLQARRFLGYQRSLLRTSPRFTIEAIREVEKVFHKKPEIRAANLATSISDAGIQLLMAFESELANARALGITADWWQEGTYRKGVSTAEQQAYAAARKALNAGGMGSTTMMGVSELGMEDVEADNLADATEADLGDDGAAPTATGAEGMEEEDLSRYDDDDDVRGYGAVASGGVPLMAMAPEDDNVVMEDA